MHAMDYMVYAYLQPAQDDRGARCCDDMIADPGHPVQIVSSGHMRSPSAPARYALERGDWKGAAELQVRPSKFAYADAMTYFARALGAARSGNPEAAQADIARLAELREKLRAAKDTYWAEQVDIQWQIATAWVLYAEGKYDGAIKAMSAAADAEDKTEKHPVTPGAPTPARELLGADAARARNGARGARCVRSNA